MLNMKLIEEAVKLVVDYYETERAVADTRGIRDSAIEWYSNTEIVDAEMLAAAVMTSPCRPHILAEITWDTLREWKEFFYPSIPFEYTEIHVHEIQEAIEDELYW